MRKLFILLAFGVTLTLNLSSCGSDSDDENDNSNPATKGEWYTEGFATYEDFREIDEAIANHELLSSRYNGDFYAEVDNFFDENDRYDTDDWKWGHLRFKPYKGVQTHIWHIIDNNLIENFYVYLYQADVDIKPKYHIFNAGRLGKLCYIAEGNPTVNTYIEYDGKLILDNGTILIRTGNDIIQSGNSEPCKRFTPAF